ncbi:hypothetical protein [Verrucosispora sp. NA02020]|uniref:hypothetical protein n=1 Tax=Verrucosispora sp. NA02020 TaxID=2742132 RepID=UPI0015905D73|nr:hypothetical protein [Verrucosispora sp. NA02020]QKW15370.1 hypothetical protein HUT12_23130 [Verrucosispora sp. NA02020]
MSETAVAEVAPSAEVALQAKMQTLLTRLEQESNNNELLQETVADLQRALYEPGWIRLTAQGEHEFSPEAMKQMRAICRLFAIKSPLIRHALNLRSSYVWGQGVEITARANGREDGQQDVQGVVRAFLDDPSNQRTLTGANARDQLETFGLGCDGEVFFALFTRPATGRVQTRVLPADEIAEIISDPEDADTPWFYLRKWTHIGRDQHGNEVRESRERLYPAIDYRPKSKPATYAGRPVDWWSPVLHVAVNQPLGWRRGIPDAYPAIDWAKAYKEFLEDWARLMRSLSRYAWKASAPGGRNGAVRTRLAAPPSRDPASGEPNHAGATAILPPDVQLEAVSKSGATLDSDSGRPLAAMVAAALGIPVTMLLGDPGITGNRATAETLDDPTERVMIQRRDVWTAELHRILRYVIAASVEAPKGRLTGSVAVDDWGQQVIRLDGNTDTTIDIEWPRLDDVDMRDVVSAVVEASGTGTVPPEVVVRLLLTALGVRRVDQIVERLTGGDGEFLWPQPPPLNTPSGAARVGGDPAASGPGSMRPDDGDDEPDEPPVEEAVEQLALPIPAPPGKGRRTRRRG